MGSAVAPIGRHETSAFIDDFHRKYYNARLPNFTHRASADLQAGVVHPPPGLYVFPADCGETYLLYFENQKALVIDGGYIAKLFASSCWEFLVKHVVSFQFLVTHIDEDHIAGLFYLTYSQHWNNAARHPICTALWMNHFDVTATRSYNDGNDIVRAAKAANIGPHGHIGGDTIMYPSSAIRVRVVCPDPASRGAYLADWKKAAKSGNSKGNAKQINAGSTVLLVEVKGGPFALQLLCADNSQPAILDGLRSMHMTVPFSCWIATLPHHGSCENSDAKFPQVIAAEHYVVSANYGVRQTSKHRGNEADFRCWQVTVEVVPIRS